MESEGIYRDEVLLLPNYQDDSALFFVIAEGALSYVKCGKYESTVEIHEGRMSLDSFR